MGAVTALQFTPMLLFTLHGGRSADRYDKRRLLVLCNIASGGCALILGVLVLSGAVRLRDRPGHGAQRGELCPGRRRRRGAVRDSN
ncbi:MULTISPECIES: hypothetical protein [unclassified Streptomyces]|uniref:hypothetical protein n=1 Tax=unclassified Streptomyces TaxID=2593676 RepID=UPI00382C36DF